MRDFLCSYRKSLLIFFPRCLFFACTPCRICGHDKSYTVKKVSGFPVTIGMSLTKLSLAVRESLVSDIAAKNGTTTNLFYSVVSERLNERFY
jgi:hypothetical protein